MRYLYIICTCFFSTTIFGQPKTDKLVEDILSTNEDTVLRKVVGDLQTYRLQIIYTQINRDKHNRPSFKNYYFNYDPGMYFNPASTVKFPLALLSLEKLNNMRIKNVNKYTSMQFDSSYAGQTTLYRDSTSPNQLPSIAHFIKKAFLVSDNDAYNRMYQFVGQQTINRSLQAKGYKDTRITRQFMGFTPEQNRHTNAIRFIKEDKSLIYEQPPAYNTDSFYFPKEIKIGNGYMTNDDSLIYQPFDFTTHNNHSLEELQRILQAVLFPASVPVKQRFNLTKDDYTFLYQYLSQYPGETNYPKYDADKFYNSCVKFFFKDQANPMPDDVRVFNKTGWAYGFLTDMSYVADFKNRVEFMLTATVYTNSDGILNDGKYDYPQVGYPFLYQLGQTFYRYELQRKRNFKPNLSAFKIQYEQRDVNDTRPAIKKVDN